MRYSEKFKAQVVRRMVGPHASSAVALSRELQIGQPTLSRWLRASLASVKKSEPSVPPSKRPLRDKMRVVLEADGLDGEDLGGLLRREGLTTADLDGWRKLGDAVDVEVQSGNGSNRKRIRELERDLRRKDKALAETAAMLVLEKKLKQLWGTVPSEGEDDDTTARSDE